MRRILQIVFWLNRLWLPSVSMVSNCSCAIARTLADGLTTSSESRKLSQQFVPVTSFSIASSFSAKASDSTSSARWHTS
uniref:Putative secreted protein n=1 Tax=Anopheles triannulatus TaxID=58253 RepID=A0A2M4B6B4_9DIPT